MSSPVRFGRVLTALAALPVLVAAAYSSLLPQVKTNRMIGRLHPPLNRPLAAPQRTTARPQPRTLPVYRPALPVEGVERSFTWTGFDGVERTWAFELTQADLAASIREYGAHPDQMKPQTVRSERTLRYSAREARDPVAMARIRAEADAEMQRELEIAISDRRAALLERGFVMIGENEIAADVARLWRLNVDRMAPYRERLAESGERSQTHAALAFVQGIPYKIPADTIGERYIAGILPPLELLAARYGDCDSKAVLFATLIDNGVDGPEVILLRGPGHMVAAVEAAPGDKGLRITAFDKEFLVCETSAATWLPGEVSADVRRQVAAGKYQAIRLR